MSDKKAKMIVNGFVFTNEAEAKQAEKEVEGVKFVKGKIDMDKPEMVLQVYNKMVRQKLFETAVGYSYLKDLQEYLQSIPFIDKADILPIQVQSSVLEEQMRRNRTKPKQSAAAKERYINIDYKNRYRVMRGIAIALAICVVAMFAISATAGSPTILNYEQKLINRYAEWEEELNEREAWIVEREAELGRQAE